MQGQSQERFPRRSREQNNRSLFRRTIFLMIALGFAAFVPLIFRLYQLQIAEHTQWEERAAGQQTKNVSVTAMRGAIYDREGRTLAMSASVNKADPVPHGGVAVGKGGISERGRRAG